MDWKKLLTRRTNLAYEIQDIELYLIQTVVDFVRYKGFEVKPTNQFDCDRPVYTTNLDGEDTDRIFPELDKKFPGWNKLILFRYNYRLIRRYNG